MTEASLSPAEAVYGFTTWLTLLPQPLLIGAGANADLLADLAQGFCQAHGLAALRGGWETTLQLPQDPYWRAGDDL